MSRTNRDLNLQTPQNSVLESTAKDLQPAPSPRVILVEGERERERANREIACHSRMVLRPESQRILDKLMR